MTDPASSSAVAKAMARQDDYAATGRQKGGKEKNVEYPFDYAQDKLTSNIQW